VSCRWPVPTGHRKSRRFLEQNDILVRGHDGLTIGFRHQTIMYFTLTRAFAVAEHLLRNMFIKGRTVFSSVYISELPSLSADCFRITKPTNSGNRGPDMFFHFIGVI
jgi:hypothetical protein